ncbi:MAG TPA: glycosyltransferase [Planctomycetota bacterium]|jgi:sugar transferase (PEP-CTERM/EpsH1 system associated)
MPQSRELNQNSSRRWDHAVPSTERRLKILIVRVRLLFPLNTGGKIRSARMIEELSQNHDVTLITCRYPEDTDEDVQRTAELCKNLVAVPYRETVKGSAAFYAELGKNLFSSLPYVVAKYASRELARTVAALYRTQRPDLVMCDFLQSCECLKYLDGVPFVLFQHNVEAALFEQMARQTASPIKRAYLALQAQRLRRYEQRICKKASCVIAVSDNDREVFTQQYGAPYCEVVPTGVDTEFFVPSKNMRAANNIVFTGSLDWLPNQDAMRYFVKEVLPLIQQEVPNVAFSIVGRNPPPEIVALGKQPGIHVTGTVNDIRPYVFGAKVYVAPLRIGSGTRLKLLEAMAMGKAIVSTTLGAEGLPVHHDQNIVLADSAADFAREVTSLLRDGQRRRTLEAQARELVERRYSWQQVGQVFGAICQRAAGKAGVRVQGSGVRDGP